MNFTREDLVVIINVLSRPQQVEMDDNAIRNVFVMNQVKKKAQGMFNSMPVTTQPKSTPMTPKDVKKVKEKIPSNKNGKRQT